MKRWEWMSWSGIAAFALLLVVAAWVAWEPTPPEAPRARLFRDYNVCLLTDARGIQSGPASTAWDGLQKVSQRTDVRVAPIAVLGEQTTARAQQFVASAVAQQCGVIVAVGDAPTAAAAAERSRYPQVKFVVLKGTESAAEVTAQVLPLVPGK